MYNLLLPKLCPTLLVDPTALLESLLASALSLTDLTLYCVVPYIVACVDVREWYFGTIQMLVYLISVRGPEDTTLSPLI